MEETGVGSREYGVGDYVMYAGNGICRIADIRTENFAGMGEKLYYVMNSVYDNGARFYIPVTEECSARLRPLFSEEKIKGIIDETEDFPHQWAAGDEERTQQFEEILRGGDIARILWLV